MFDPKGAEGMEGAENLTTEEAERTEKYFVSCR